MQKIRIDFDNPGLPQHISAVENDSQSRFFQATLYENGKAYTAPEGATYSIMYRGFGPQNQGWYDTINDGAGKRAACAVSGNVVTCEIARQALQVPGHVSIVLCVTTGKGYMLKSWPIECDCKNDHYDSTVEIQSFFYVTQVSNESWTQAIQAVEELKNTIDPTLSISGKAADAAKVGEAVNAETTRAKAAEEENAKGIGQLKEDLGSIKKKKNVVIYVGSAELSAEQKLSCDYVCDGVDDQIEINQAIDSLPDSGGEIHLSRGIFNISNSVTIRKRIKITGEGKGITLDRNNVNNGGTTLLSELTGGAIILIDKSDTLSDIKGITLSDFQIVGAGINLENNYCNGINITTYTDCVTLERLSICHCFYGLFVDQSATVDDISVTNCDFQRDSCGIYIYGQGWQTRIENNIFWDMHGGHGTVGIALSAGKNIVNGNYFGVSALVKKSVVNSWISAKNAVSLLCNGNSFSRCTSSPIRFEAGGQFASISGNSFSEIGQAQFQPHERAVLYVDGAGTGGGRISFTNNTVFWANDDTWKTSYLAYLTNQVAQVNISNNTVIDGIGKINEDELVYKSEDSAYAITIGNNVLC